MALLTSVLLPSPSAPVSLRRSSLPDLSVSLPPGSGVLGGLVTSWGTNSSLVSAGQANKLFPSSSPFDASLCTLRSQFQLQETRLAAFERRLSVYKAQHATLQFANETLRSELQALRETKARPRLTADKQSLDLLLRSSNHTLEVDESIEGQLPPLPSIQSGPSTPERDSPTHPVNQPFTASSSSSPSASHLELQTINDQLRAEIVELKQSNAYLTSDADAANLELSRVRTEFYGERAQARFQLRTIQAIRDRNAVLEKNVADRDRFIHAVAQTHIHYPVIGEAYEAVKEGTDPEDALVDAILRASSNPKSVWSKLIPRIVGPRSADEYIAAIHLALDAQKQLVKSRKVSNFWKTLAQCDPDNATTITPSTSILPEDIRTLSHLSKEPVVVDDLLAVLNAERARAGKRTSISPKRARYDSDSPFYLTKAPHTLTSTRAAFTDEADHFAADPNPPKSIASSSPDPGVAPVVPTGTVAQERAESAEEDSSSSTIVPSTMVALADTASQETVTPAALNRQTRLTSRIPITSPRKRHHSTSPASKLVNPHSPKVGASGPAPRTVKATFSFVPPSPSSSKVRYTPSIPIRSRLSTPQRSGTNARLPLTNVTNKSSSASRFVVRKPAKPQHTNLAGESQVPSPSFQQQRPSKPSAKELGKRRGVIMSEVVPLFSREGGSSDKSIQSNTRSSDVILVGHARNVSLEGVYTPHDKPQSRRSGCSSSSSLPPTSTSPAGAVVRNSTGSSTIPDSPSGALATVNRPQTSVTETNPETSPATVIIDVAAARRLALEADEANASLERLVSIFDDSDLGSLEMSDEEPCDSDSDIDALLDSEDYDDFRRVPSYMSDLERLRHAFELEDQLQTSMHRRTTVNDVDSSLRGRDATPDSPTPTARHTQTTLPYLQSISWAASRRRNASTSSSSSSGSSASIDSPSKYVKRVKRSIATSPLQSKVDSGAAAITRDPSSSSSRPPPRPSRIRTTKVQTPTRTWVPAASLPQSPTKIEPGTSPSLSIIDEDSQQLDVLAIPSKLTRSPAIRKRQFSLDGEVLTLAAPGSAHTSPPSSPCTSPSPSYSSSMAFAATPPTVAMTATITSAGKQTPPRTTAARRETPSKFPRLVVPAIEIPEPSYGEISPPLPQIKPRSHTINTISPVPSVSPPAPSTGRGTVGSGGGGSGGGGSLVGIRALSPLVSPTKPRSHTFNTFSPTTRSPLSQHVITNSSDGSNSGSGSNTGNSRSTSLDIAHRREGSSASMSPPSGANYPIPKRGGGGGGMAMGNGMGPGIGGAKPGRSTPRDSMPPPPTAVFMRPPTANHGSRTGSTTSIIGPLIPEVPATPNGTAGTLSTAQCRTLLKRGFKFSAPR